MFVFRYNGQILKAETLEYLPVLPIRAICMRKRLIYSQNIITLIFILETFRLYSRNFDFILVVYRLYTRSISTLFSKYFDYARSISTSFS